MIEKIFESFGLPKPVLEYRFHPKRRWRIDICYPDLKLAIEQEGGVFSFGRHTRPIGFAKDMEKYNALTELGWHLLRYQPNKFDYEQIKRVYDMLDSKKNCIYLKKPLPVDFGKLKNA